MTPFETAAGLRKTEGTDAQHLINVGACEIVSHLRRKEANPALGRGAGGRIVNFFQNDDRAMSVSLPDYFWLYKRDCGAVLDEKGRK